MKLDRAAIEERVPHAGVMCLLDAVHAWDADSIECGAAAPGAGHPLARDGIVPAVVAIEYAAQATAVHGALLSGDAQRGVGVLAKLSEVVFERDALEPLSEPLAVRAQLIARSERGCLYAFVVSGEVSPVARGTLMVVLGTEILP